MHFSNIAIPILGLASLTAAAPRRPKPWEVTSLDYFSPTGLTSKTRTLSINITDPNDPTVSPAICDASWHYDEPSNGTVACAKMPGGQWSFTKLPSGRNQSLGLADFIVRFELKRKGQRFVGSHEFTSDGNNHTGDLTGSCGPTYSCGFWLKDESTPVRVSWAKVDE